MKRCANIWIPSTATSVRLRTAAKSSPYWKPHCRNLPFQTERRQTGNTAEERIPTDRDQMGNVNDFRRRRIPIGHRDEFAVSNQKKNQRLNQIIFWEQRDSRDKSRKILGGVCSGLAHYFSIDSSMVRLILCAFRRLWRRLLLSPLFFGSLFVNPEEESGS